MESIKTILPSVLKNIKRKQGYGKEDLGKLWKRCIKRGIAQHTKAIFLKKAVLYVVADNPAWLYELRIKKDEILEKLNKLSKNKIKDVRFRIGDIDDAR